MRIYGLLAPLLVFSVVSGCAREHQRERTSKPERTIVIDGRERTFRWHLPPTTAAAPHGPDASGVGDLSGKPGGANGVPGANGSGGAASASGAAGAASAAGVGGAASAAGVGGAASAGAAGGGASAGAAGGRAGSDPRPLVMMLHGGFGTGEQAEGYYGWDALADAEGFAVVYPDGLDRAWNVGGSCCGVPGRAGVDDVAFLRAVVEQMDDIVPGGVDPSRVYATGISNGGLMAYRLACDTDLFAAIGPDSATLLGACPKPAPVSVLHIHGAADTRIRMDGAEGDGVARIDGPPVAEVVASWRAVDGCEEPSAVVAGVVTTSVARCPAGRAVELVTIDGAGHQWPGSASKPLVQKVLGTDEPSTALDATAVFWAFFAAHPRR
ncbi:extracellular catalytic domain type 1 short-chain-length polyhydroxyalkanoate depolymerase [Dactylosporangium darangshiense]|uniref:Polyhydroxybutyrate depolymerase n=1 Tax=Dactylosporangium darangshiense TaxID=579108 RepID=A0ABP8D8Y0_9ACTN